MTSKRTAAAAERTGKTRPSTDVELPLRITVVRPPAGILFCVQGRPAEFLSPTRTTGADVAFDVSVRVAGELASGAPRLLGVVVQGPPAQRFLYIGSGTYAGDEGSCWARRAKVPLTGITSALIARRRAGARLAARIAGTAGDGGPVCASVKLLGSGWTWTP